jgi:hypothetical protein
MLALLSAHNATAQPVVQQYTFTLNNAPLFGGNPKTNQTMDQASCQAILANIQSTMPSSYTITTTGMPNTLSWYDPDTKIGVTDTCLKDPRGLHRTHVASNQIIGTPSPVALPTSPMVIVADGQSYFGNRIDELMIAAPGVIGYPYLYPDQPSTGGTLQYQDPDPMTDGQGGNVLTRLATELVTSGKATGVVAGSVALGGSSIVQHLPGTPQYIKAEAYLRALGHGLGLIPTYILWDEGQTATFAGISTATWVADFEAIVDGYNEDMGLTSTKWVVAQESLGYGRPATYGAFNAADIISDVESALNIRAAQAAVVGYNSGQVLTGPDMDALIKERFTLDGVHPDGVGASLRAAAWLPTLN